MLVNIYAVKEKGRWWWPNMQCLPARLNEMDHIATIWHIFYRISILYSCLFILAIFWYCSGTSNTEFMRLCFSIKSMTQNSCSDYHNVWFLSISFFFLFLVIEDYFKKKYVIFSCMKIKLYQCLPGALYFP